MGTLFDQPERDFNSCSIDDIDDFLASAQKVSKARGCSLSDVIAAAAMLEVRRRNDLAVLAGNVLDEQLAGLGGILGDLRDEVSRIAEFGAG